MSWIICPDEKNGLLDIYPGAAAAYSLRNLQGRSGKDSAVVRVRRSSDNTESDFTATQVSDGTLAAWVGAGNGGFVRTWYDQSGNNINVTQATSGQQPILVSGGAVLTERGKPRIDFDTTDNLIASFSRTEYAAFCIFSANSLDSGFCAPVNINGASGLGVRPSLKLYDAMGVFNSNALNNTVALGERVLLTSLNFASTSNLYKNSTLVSTASGSIVSRSQIALGSAAAAIPATSTIQEVVFYTTDQSTNRAAIEANINAHYAIY